MANQNQNNENSGLGCGLFAIIIGSIFAIMGKSWGCALLIFGLIVVVATILFNYQDKVAKEKERKYKERHDQRASRVFELREKKNQLDKPTISVAVTTDDDAGYEYSIKGINYRNIDDSMLGDFIGTVRALKSNPHDTYAIGVYCGNKRIGFLPRGNKELHAKIVACGGSVDAEGYIAKADDGERTFYYGKVNLLGIC